MSKRSRDNDDDEFVEEITTKKIKKWPFNPEKSTPENEIANDDDIREGDILMSTTGNQASQRSYKVMRNEEGLYPEEIIKEIDYDDYYGGKRKRSRKTKKSRKSKKSRKTKRSKKSKKTRKSRK